MRAPTGLRAVALVAVLALALVACGDDDGDGAGTTTGAATDGASPGGDFDLISEGTLTVCSDVPYAPFEMEDADAPTGYTGFDIDLMSAVAQRLDLDLAVVDSGFDAIQSGQALAAGQCDIAASAMTITEDREENIDFSVPYFDADQSLLVRADDTETYQDLEDLAGETIGVQADTTGQDYAEENTPEGATVREYPDAAALFAAMEAGEIEAILQDYPVNAYRATQEGGVVVTATFETDERYGFAVREEGSEALLDAVNAALVEMGEDGTYAEIFREYFGEDPTDVPSEAVDGEDEASPAATGS